jgi:hypothetical protein
MTTSKTPGRPGDDPVPPIPIPPSPPKITNFWTGVLVFFITEAGMGLRYAYSTFGHFADFNQYLTLDHWPELLKISFNGFLYGLIPGFIVACSVVLAAAGGPELWSYVGPIIMAAAKSTMNFVRGVSRAVRGMPLEPHEKDDKQGDK